MKNQLPLPTKIDIINDIIAQEISCNIKINDEWIGSVFVTDFNGLDIEVKRVDNNFPMTINLYQINDITHL